MAVYHSHILRKACASVRWGTCMKRFQMRKTMRQAVTKKKVLPMIALSLQSLMRNTTWAAFYVGQA